MIQSPDHPVIGGWQERAIGRGVMMAGPVPPSTKTMQMNHLLLDTTPRGSVIFLVIALFLLWLILRRRRR